MAVSFDCGSTFPNPILVLAGARGGEGVPDLEPDWDAPSPLSPIIVLGGDWISDLGPD